MRFPRHLGTLITALLLLLPPASSAAETSEADRPHFIVILADDMGYSDIGAFGGEIATPRLDRLAEDGLLMTRFYNAARCCPSRASLLTGQHPHAAGMGSMSDQEIDLPSYRGYLGPDVVTLAELLGPAGYDCHISGKWHVGHREEHWPGQRGFDRVFSFIHGASSYWDNGPYRNSEWPWSDGRIFTVLDGEIRDYPEGTYATDLYTDYGIRFIDESLAGDRPFFLYLSYTAPHWPLHAPEEDIARYRGRYDAGWTAIREERAERQRETGLFPASYPLPESDERIPAWENLPRDEKARLARKMEVYAAMVDRMDQNIGRLVDHLGAAGELENTLIVFLSDNGASPAGGVSYLHERFDPDAPPGGPDSFTAYGRGWAEVSNTPFRNYKATVHEGGVATPFIAHWPRGIPAGLVSHEPGHLVDLMPTLMELAGADYPEERNGESIRALAGKSLTPLFSGQSAAEPDAADSGPRELGFEHHGHRAFLRGRHKLIGPRDGEWEYYDLSEDRTETEDRIDSIPAGELDRLMRGYRLWAAEQGVFPEDIVDKRTR